MGSYNRKLRYDELIHTFLTALPLLICVVAAKYADRLFGPNLDHILLGLALTSGVIALVSYALACRARGQGRHDRQALIEVAWCMTFTIACVVCSIIFIGFHIYTWLSPG